MKRGLKVLVGLACFFVIGLPVFSQPSAKSLATVLMDDFDSVGAQDYLYAGQKYSWEWGVQASRFVADGFPKLEYFNGISNSLAVLKRGMDGERKCLGVQVSYKRKGDNWFEVFPTKDDKAFEPVFQGTVNTVDFWVWGANYNYYLEMLVRDANGTVHVLKVGSLAFSGWRNIVVKIPGWLCQHSKLRSGPPNMTFVGFRIRSDAGEFVDDYAIFFDELKYTTNTLSDIYDGYDLRDVFESAVDSESSDEVKDGE